MVHCCQNSNLAFFLFDEKKNTCLYFLNLFPKSKNKKKPGTIAVNMVTLAPKADSKVPGFSTYRKCCRSLEDKNL